MNQRQRESVAKYLYDMSEAVHVGWLIGYAAGKVSWYAAIFLAILGTNLFINAYKKEAVNG